jgi:FG-GAP-like repeat
VVMNVLGKILVFILLSSGFCAARCGATIYYSNGSAANVQALHNAALNGDTITLPAGMFTWSRPVTISKAITLQGQGIGATVIRDAVQSGSLMEWNLIANQASRMTGIEFHNGGRINQSQNGIISIKGIAYDNRTMRIDHCKFEHLNGLNVLTRDVLGVIDHNTFLEVGTEAIQVWNEGWAGGAYGNGSWIDTNHFGTGQFLFIEDNGFIYGVAYGAIDAYAGARYVARHNTFVNCHHGGHGTEGQRNRGMRAIESYNNAFTGANTPGVIVNIRGGVALIHDNTVSGSNPRVTKWFALRCNRAVNAFDAYWHGADGQSQWDVNQSGGPFFSGTAYRSSSGLTVTVAGNPGWTTNQWQGYCVKRTTNLRGASDEGFSEIESNTSNTITYSWAGSYNNDLSFASGDSMEFRKVNHALDQPGRSGGSAILGVPPVRPPAWNDQVTDPCYEWNNVDTSGGQAVPIHFSAAQSICRINEHYFNSTQAPGYTPYIYPHPLTVLPVGTARAVVGDFNGDGRPDYVLQKPHTRETAIWYLDKNVYTGSDAGPTVAAGWGLRCVADFNRDSHPDYALFTPVTDQTALWYLSGPTLIGGVLGPRLPNGWEFAATTDFNGDGKPDYLLYRSDTRQTAVWYLNDNILTGGDVGPTVPPGWTLVGAADFNSDGHPDYFLFHPSSSYTAIAYLSGTTIIGAAWGPALPPGWALVGAADFNNDDHPDYLLYNWNAQLTAMWYLSGVTVVGSDFAPALPPGWSFLGP